MYKEERYSRVVGFTTNVTDATIARDVPLKKQRNVDKKHSVVALDHRKNVHSKLERTFILALIIATAVKNNLGHSTRKRISNDLEPHFRTSATLSGCLQVTKTAAALPHCGEST